MFPRTVERKVLRYAGLDPSAGSTNYSLEGEWESKERPAVTNMKKHEVNALPIL